MNIINGRIIDSDLIKQEFHNLQFRDALVGNLKLDEVTDINIKKLLIYLNPEIISSIDLNNIDNDTKSILKSRCEIYEENNKNIFDNIINFYRFLEEKSLYGIMKKILTLNKAEKELYEENYLLPSFIVDNLKDNLKSVSFVKEMVKKDFRLCEFIDINNVDKEELVRFMIENNIENVQFIKNNITENLANDRNLIIKYILMSPIAYRCFDHHMIDEAMIKILIDSWEPNKYYRNFCSDFRFYQRNKVNKNSNIYKVISKYISLTKQGQDYIGLCPFHDDHNPSLRVCVRKGVWKCFACGIGGDAKKFVKEYTCDYIFDSSDNQEAYKNNMKNQFLYYLFANLPENLKRDKNIIRMFLEKDGCILKLVHKDIKYDSELVNVAIENDVTSFRYIINNEELRNKYVSIYPVLNYYLPKIKKD